VSKQIPDGAVLCVCFVCVYVPVWSPVMDAQEVIQRSSPAKKAAPVAHKRRSSFSKTRERGSSVQVEPQV
jgi:hypothetical protein